jgi:RNA polymerase primary sigma factor
MSTQRGKELDELAPYVGAVRKYPLLTREQERDLATRARSGDVAAKQQMARHNLGLVLAIACKQPRGALRLEDLVQEGNIGLMHAVEKFDPRVGTRFSTYAAWWIRAFVGRYLKEARSAVRPRSGTVAYADLSLDAPVGDEEGSVSHLDLVPDERPGPESRTISSNDDSRVRASLSRIRHRVGPLGWDIIHRRLEQDPPETLEQIGRRWGVSRERVRQVEAQTKQFLHRYLERVCARDDVCDAA